MRPWSALFVLAGVATSCSRDLTEAVIATNGVFVSAIVTSRTAVGDSVRIHIVNAGDRTAFISRCGSSPLLLVQQYSGGEWVGGVQTFSCVAPSEPGPVVIAPSGSLDVIRVFSTPGRYRMTTAVSTHSSLADASLATSNAFAVP